MAALVAPSTSRKNRASLLQQIVTDQTHPTLKQLLRDSAESFIHPILARKRWMNINHQDYLRIVPAIAVATRMLTGDRAMHFWHALLFRPESATDGTHKKFRCAFKDPDISLPAEEREKVKRMLNELAQIVMFDCEDLSESTDARTIVTDEHFNPGVPGVGSHITLRRALVDEIDLQARPPSAILRRWFIIAATLLHKIAHALCAARYGFRQEREFEDDDFVEIGCALEKWLFGGQPGLTWVDRPEESVVLCEIGCQCAAHPRRCFQTNVVSTQWEAMESVTS